MLGDTEKTGLPLVPLVLALAFGACLGGKPTATLCKLLVYIIILSIWLNSVPFVFVSYTRMTIPVYDQSLHFYTLHSIINAVIDSLLRTFRYLKYSLLELSSREICTCTELSLLLLLQVMEQ